MVLFFVVRLFSWFGLGHLVPHVLGLAHLGRPSRVAFPVELIEQGVSVMLTGLNNTMAVQSNPDWVWAWWAERQGDPDAPEFIPTGLNLLKSNLTRRNWTTLGREGSPWKAMVDPVGMLTLQAYGWSAFPFLRRGGVTHVPPRLTGKVRQERMEGDLNAVLTKYLVFDDLAWESEQLAVRIGLEEFVLSTHRLENRSPEPLTFHFGVAIRPYNVLSVGHINHIRIKKNLWKVNGLAGLFHLETPDMATAGDRHIGDPLLLPPETPRTELVSRSGIACGHAEWNVTLLPGESRAVQTLGYLNPLAARGRPKRRKQLKALAPAARDAALSRWRERREEGLQLRFPEEALRRRFEAVKNHSAVFDDGDRFSPGSFLYHQHWFRDTAFLVMAVDNLGHFDRSRPKLEDYPRRQKANGFFRSHTGEWDSNGEAIWTLINHARKTGDREFLRRVWPSIRKGVRWIDRMRMKEAPAPHRGLLPAGFSAEHFGPNDHYFWDNFWSLAAVERAAWAARALAEGADFARFTKLAAEYRRDLEAAIEGALAKNQGVLPSSPYRRPDSACIGNMVATAPLGLVPTDAPWMAATVQFLLQNNLRDGLFFQRIIHTGLNPYLSAQLARTLLSIGDDRGFLKMLRRIGEVATSTDTWPEAIHPRVGGGCMGDGDHGWSAAEFISLIRECFVLEKPDGLVFAAGVPLEWLASRGELSVRRAPTDWGMVEWTLEPVPAGHRFTWSLVPNAFHEPLQMELSLPGLGPTAPRRRMPLLSLSGSLTVEDPSPRP